MTKKKVSQNETSFQSNMHIANLKKAVGKTKAMFQYEGISPTSQELKALALEAVEFFENNPDTLKLQEFYIYKGIFERTFQRWADACPDLKDAQTYIKQLLGVRRERGGLKRELDSHIVRVTMPIYDPDWRNLEEWRSKLKEDTVSTGAKIVVIEKITDERNGEDAEEVALVDSER